MDMSEPVFTKDPNFMEFASHQENRTKAEVRDALEDRFGAYRKYSSRTGYQANIVGMARHYGSTAQTSAGARRYLLSRISSIRPIFTLASGWESHRKVDNGYTRKAWEQNERWGRMNSDDCSIFRALKDRSVWTLDKVDHSVSSIRPKLRDAASIRVTEDLHPNKRYAKKKFLVCEFPAESVRLHKIVGHVVGGRVVLDASHIEHGIYRVGVSVQRKGGVYEIEERFAYTLNKRHHLLKAKTVEKAQAEAMAIALKG